MPSTSNTNEHPALLRPAMDGLDAPTERELAVWQVIDRADALCRELASELALYLETGDEMSAKELLLKLRMVSTNLRISVFADDRRKYEKD